MAITDDALQRRIEQIGEEILSRIRREKTSLFEGWQGRLMDWTMRDERFKAALFRFVDVLPALHRSREVTGHLREYLGGGSSAGGNGHAGSPRAGAGAEPGAAASAGATAPSALRPLLSASGSLPWLAAPVVRRGVTAMANRFIAGATGRSALPVLRKRAKHGMRFTVDILGETAVSETEAEEYATRYGGLMETLAASKLPDPNVSIKISALYSQIHPAAPEVAIERLKNRLRPLVRRAQELGVFINFDMEHYALKDLTLALFRSLLDEAEFHRCDRLGIVIQAYLRESERDLAAFLDWARARPGQFTVRLVKGAYWDYERIVARQRGWPVPVWEGKAETDACYERLTRMLLENHAVVRSAFGTHNVRNMAPAIACAEALGVGKGGYEFQMLYGMSEPVASALLALGHAVREYAPVGEIIPGMGYLVRRLLENTSNEGFLRAAFDAQAPPEALLRDPREDAAGEAPTHFERAVASLDENGAAPGTALAPDAAMPFQNEPPSDFTREGCREKMRAALVTVRTQFPIETALLIDGREVRTAAHLRSVNPARPSEVVGIIARASADHCKAALDAAARAGRAWRERSAGERASVLERAARIMRERNFELAALEVLETGKPWVEADADVAEAIDFCNFYASEMRRLGAPQRTDDVPGELSVQHYLPRGIGVVIAPWNFPVAILCGMTAAALVTGNCVLMKPAEQSSVLAYRLAEIFRAAGVPAGVLALVTGVGEEIGEYLIQHPQVDFVAFTGSKEVGLKIYEATGKHFAKAVCEMGGKNALIIDSDADLDEAVAGARISAFGYSGQKCSALSRLIVLDEIHDRFLARLIDATRSLAVGSPEQPETIVGPLIDEAAHRRVLDYVARGELEARLVFKGEMPGTADGGDSGGYYCPPVIFADVPRGARIAREEIFGPVLCVFRAADFDEALALANDSAFALTGGLYSRSPARIERVKRELAAGNVYINRPITGAIVKRHPFGGFRLSGTGTKAGGRDYLLHFMLPRVVTENVLRRGFAPEAENPGLAAEGL